MLFDSKMPVSVFEQIVRVRVPSPARAVPASLQASLMARLDRLGPAKEVAQIGAVIGREFSYPAARCMWPMPTTP